MGQKQIFPKFKRLENGLNRAKLEKILEKRHDS